MTQWLKLSTAATIPFGPFVDETDGRTPQTGLTIAQGDIRLSKNGGSFAESHDAAGATHDENGYYALSLDATDTNTPGRLRVAVSASGALPVWQDFLVVPANVHDTLVAGSDKLDVNAAEVDGSAAKAAYLDAAVSGRPTLAAIEGSAILAKEATSGAIRAKTDALPASPAATGDAMALTPAAVDAVLDEAVDGALTVREALTGMAARLFGLASGGGSAAVTFRRRDGATAALIFTVDGAGNRAAVVENLS